MRAHRPVGRILPLAAAALCCAACEGGAVQSEPRAAEVPRLTVEEVRGTYTGSMTTARGVEAVVLGIHEIAPLQEGYTFRYTLNVREHREDGVGTLRPGDTSTRVCFDKAVCGWLLWEEGGVRIADSGDLDAPSWSLEKF